MLWYKNRYDIESEFYLYICNSGDLYLGYDFPYPYIAVTPITEEQFKQITYNFTLLDNIEIEGWVYYKIQYLGIKKLQVKGDRKKIIKYSVASEYLSIDDAIKSIDEGFIKNEYPCEECRQEHKQLRDWLVELKISRMGGQYPKNIEEYLSIDEAIKHIDEMFADHRYKYKPWPSNKVKMEHKQLRDWLMELRERREQKKN